MTRDRFVGSFWLGAAALLVAAALIAIVALLRGELTETDGKILLSAAGAPMAERVLDELDGVQLVATREPLEGSVDMRLARGERLVLRRRPTSAS